MTSECPMECGVCHEIFNEERCPRILPCSHNLCNECIKMSITTGLEACPFCLNPYNAQFPEEFMINDGVLECAKYFLNSRKEHPPPLQRVDSSYLGKVEYLKSEAFETNGKLLRILDQSEKQLESYSRNAKELEVSLNKINKDIRENILVIMDEIVLKNNRSREELDATSNLLKEQLVCLASEKSKLEVIKEKISLSHTYKDLTSLMEEVEGVGVSSRKWTENLAEVLSREESTVHSKEKDMEVIQDKMKVLYEVLSRVKDGENLEEPCEGISSTNTLRDAFQGLVQQQTNKPQVLPKPKPQTEPQIPSRIRLPIMALSQTRQQAMSRTQPHIRLRTQPQTQQQTSSETQPPARPWSFGASLFSFEIKKKSDE
ncbi:uncharacterized protein [Palaemon carinicauda]|uniref:uncharacterized protein n=1 Tax=Palaemon carinicauda TaxID=392227 RepID=UPI0035B66E25